MADEWDLTGDPPIIRFSGIFDFAGMYAHVANWLKFREYTFSETKYNYKPSGLGNEIEINWEGQKKIDEYHEKRIDVKILMYDYREIEVIQDGEKKNLVKARMVVHMNGHVWLDYQNRFEENKLWTKVRSWFHKHIYRRTIEFAIWDPFYHELYALHSEIKEFLNMQALSRAYA